jgi:hypothetical protein
MPEATWKPHEKHGRLTTQSDLPASVYAFPKQRKEPLTGLGEACVDEWRKAGGKAILRPEKANA